MGNKENFEDLNDYNYIIWRNKMMFKLKRKKLWKVVNKGEDTSINEDTMDMAMGLIGEHCNNDYVDMISKYESPHKAWKALEKHFEELNKHSLRVITPILNQFHWNGLNVQKNYDNFKCFVRKFKGCGGDRGEYELCLDFLRYCPKDYPVGTIRTMPDLNLSKVKSLLETEYNEMNQCKRNKKDKSSEILNTNTQKTCFFCKKIGHLKKDCFKYQKWLKNKNQKGESNVVEKGHQNKEDDELILVAESESLFCDKLDKNNWIFDSGATDNITFNKDLLHDYRKVNDRFVRTADGTPLNVEGIGSIKFDKNSKNYKLQEVLHVPKIKRNLISIKSLTSGGCMVIFKDNEILIKRNNNLIMKGILVDSLYVLDNNPSDTYNLETSIIYKNDLHLWHNRLGHVNEQQLKELLKHADGINFNKNDKLSKCSVCIEGKLTRSRKYYENKTKIKTKQILERIHTDLCGKLPVPTNQGYEYFVSYIDDYSRFSNIYLLKRKCDQFETLRNYIAKVELKTGNKVKIIRCDGGGEYICNVMRDWCRIKGIQLEYTHKNSPFENAVAERYNKTELAMMRCCIIQSGVPKSFWGEAAIYCNEIRNMLITRSTGVTPYEKFYKIKPNLVNVKVFGCQAYVYTKQSKLDKRAIKGTFIGFNKFNTKGYKILLEDDSVIYSRDVVFDENIFPYKTQKYTDYDTDSDSTSDSDTDGNKVSIPQNVTNNTDNNLENTKNTDKITTLRRSTRKAKPTTAWWEKHEALNTIEDICLLSFDNNIPKNYQEATTSPDYEHWKNAMDEEYNSLIENGTFELVQLPKNKKVISTRWVYDKKTNSN